LPSLFLQSFPSCVSFIITVSFPNNEFRLYQLKTLFITFPSQVANVFLNKGITGSDNLIQARLHAILLVQSIHEDISPQRTRRTPLLSLFQLVVK
jgi:hypothetical protein